MSDHTAEAGVPPVRASDAERDQAVEALHAAYTEGRLTRDELDERVTVAYAAKTRADLRDVLGDLPGALSGPPATDGGRPATGLPVLYPDAGPRINWCLLVCLLIACPPAGIAYLILASRRQPPPPAITRGANQ